MYKVGDLVRQLHRNVKTTRSYDKLNFQRLSLIVISNQVNNITFRLDLPSHMHLHPIFHVSLLEPWTPSSIPNQVVPSPPLGRSYFELQDHPQQVTLPCRLAWIHA